MNTTNWGPSFWVSFHCIALNSRPTRTCQNELDEYNMYYSALKTLLPCSYCRNSYTVMLHFLPVNLFSGTNTGLIYWTYLIHSFVNNKLNHQNITMDEFLNLYRPMCIEDHYLNTHTNENIINCITTTIINWQKH